MRAEVTFEGEWAQTLNGQPFLLVEDEEQDKIIIFSTIENLHTLAAATDIYIDGTFYTFPQLFYQIFTIHAMKFSRQFPLAYCLLPNKTQETYERTFNLLKQKCAELHIELNPTTIMSDFELAIIQAVQLTFPLTTPKGCYFHFCKCLTGKVQTLGLQVWYITFIFASA